MEPKLKEIDKTMKLNQKYIISSLTGRNGKQRAGADFHAILREKLEDFYIFENTKGYRECILRVDFAIGEYTAREV